MCRLSIFNKVEKQSFMLGGGSLSHIANKEINSLSSVTVRVSVVLKRTVGDSD